MTASAGAIDDFRAAYAAQRAAEGKGFAGADLLSLPYLQRGPLARQWRVRAATYDAFLRRVIRPRAMRKRGLMRILDLGAGNGWLSYRLALEGHLCTAVDIRDDDVDGLGARGLLVRRVAFAALIASFDSLPLPDAAMDVTLFNASLHYSTDLRATLSEAMRVTRPGGCIAILDSPFYARESAGTAMVAEKRETAALCFGERAETLLSLPCIEFLTRDRLAATGLGLRWRRHRVLYPAWYEFRGLAAAVRRRRIPSRFDFWTAEVS